MRLNDGPTVVSANDEKPGDLEAEDLIAEKRDKLIDGLQIRISQNTKYHSALHDSVASSLAGYVPMPVSSPKYQKAEALLSDDLRPLFRRMVEEYEYLTQIHYGRGYVAYKVLADMILAGWRPSGPPDPNSKL